MVGHGTHDESIQTWKGQALPQGMTYTYQPVMHDINADLPKLFAWNQGLVVPLQRSAETFVSEKCISIPYQRDITIEQNRLGLPLPPPRRQLVIIYAVLGMIRLAFVEANDE